MCVFIKGKNVVCESRKAYKVDIWRDFKNFLCVLANWNLLCNKPRRRATREIEDTQMKMLQTAKKRGLFWYLFLFGQWFLYVWLDTKYGTVSRCFTCKITQIRMRMRTFLLDKKWDFVWFFLTFLYLENIRKVSSERRTIFKREIKLAKKSVNLELNKFYLWLINIMKTWMIKIIHDIKNYSIFEINLKRK